MGEETPAGKKGSILVVDDNPTDLKLLSVLLTEQGYLTHPVSAGKLALGFVQSTLPDLILLDIMMPGMDGYQVCRHLKADPRTRPIPVIFMTALGEIEDKIAGLKLGAVDYITKPFQFEKVLARVNTHLSLHTLQKRLEAQNRQLQQEMAQRRQAEEALQKAHTELEQRVKERTADLALGNRMLTISSACNQAVMRTTQEPALLQEICRIIIELGGYPMVWIGYAEQDAARTVRPAAQAGFEDGYLNTVNITWADSERGRGPTGRAIRSGKPCIARDIRNKPDFTPWRQEALRRGYASSLALPLRGAGRVFGALNIYAAMPDAFHAKEVNLLMELANDLSFGITALWERAARKKAEEDLHQHAFIVSTTPDLLSFVDKNYVYQTVNEAYLRAHQKTRDEIVGFSVAQLHGVNFFNEVIKPEIDRCLAGKPVHYAAWFDYPGLGRRYMDVTYNPYRDQQGEIAGIVVSIHDITERKLAEEQRETLQAQLIQAQKMELLGRLAGGVAHDFNNILAVILGHTELTLMKIAPSDPLRAGIQEIEKAALRSADLTRQLLAFARNQTISPVVLNLNETISAMLNLLKRLIGEDIELVWTPKTDLWPVKVDPSQIDQVLTNLCVNSRDAIAGVGRIIIETSNIVFDEAYCASHSGVLAGQYVLLCVSDNGCGMDEATQAHLFEPFFTTKGIGQGTGLGLATVYGIVKQNDGFIKVSSEPGKGAMFRLYFPRHADVFKDARVVPLPAQEFALGQETVLLVEDEPEILTLCQAILEKLGYRVIGAATPGKAIHLVEEQAVPIHLLITDVVMPEMNGPDLVKQLQVRYPNLKCLFMSGYTANIIVHKGILDADVHFIQKPFTVKDLAAKVRQALEQEKPG